MSDPSRSPRVKNKYVIVWHMVGFSVRKKNENYSPNLSVLGLCLTPQGRNQICYFLPIVNNINYSPMLPTFQVVNH